MEEPDLIAVIAAIVYAAEYTTALRALGEAPDLSACANTAHAIERLTRERWQRTTDLPTRFDEVKAP